MARTQQYRAMAAATPLGPDALLLRSMTGREEVGRLFVYDLELLSEDHHVDFDAMLGQNVTVSVRSAQSDTAVRYFNGYVSRFVQLSALGRLARYQATLVPWLWFLTRTADCKIYQEKNVPDIVADVFRQFGFTEFQNRLNGSYRTWEYCVQYRETAFNFISRLMEQEGIYYYFLHENGKHTLVLSDGPACHDPFPDYKEVPYMAKADAKSDMEYVWDWTVAQSVQPGAYALNDFDFKLPKKSLLARATQTRSHPNSSFEIYDYPGEYSEFGDGDAYAKVRNQELQAQYEVVRGEADVRGIAPGFAMTLTGHPRPDQNRKYLVTSMRVEAVSDEFDSTGAPLGKEPVYRCEFTGIDASQQFRAPRLTPMPVVQGPQTAIVVGPAGEEVDTDEHGRVRVLFHWDRYHKPNEDCSCRVRVAQVWAGSKWGAMFIPRIGQEVIVEFLEGDPDRPIITGRVYNGVAVPPYALPANKTRSTIKTNSTKGGDGFNEIRFEDKKGEEQLFIHAEKDEDERVKNDSREFIGQDRDLIVKRHQKEKVEKDKHTIVLGDRFQKIGGQRHLTVTGDEMKKVAANQHLEVTTDQNEKVGGNASLTVGSKKQDKVGTNYAMDAGMEIHLKGGMKVVVEAGMQLTLKVGGNFVDISPVGVTIQGTLVNINSGGAAGSGSGSSPTSPTAPEAPEEPKEAASDKAGKVDEVPKWPKPPAAVTFSPQATVLQQAAQDGTPFCEKCEAARKAQQQGQ